MCTLIALWRSVEGYDVVVGMNRDESAARRSEPPRLHEGDPPIVAPRDAAAGGTWIGASASGLVAGLSNRRGPTSTSARSRGLLVLDVLRQPSVAAADVFLQREVRMRTYNLWNMFVASRKEARFFRYEGEVSTTRGHEGLNVLTNEGGNVPTDPKVAAVQGLLAKASLRGSDDATRALIATLRTHAARPGETALCLHAPGGGTVSSTILALSVADPGENVLLYADGPPCVTPYRDYREVVRRLPVPT
ncbi:MAG: NRDE family protein [Methanobacteriota archaeon]